MTGVPLDRVADLDYDVFEAAVDAIRQQQGQ